MKNFVTQARLAQFTTMLVLVTALGSSVFASAPAEAPDGSPKGMYLSGTPGLKFHVSLDRDGEKRRVSSNHRFLSGDRMRFELELNEPMIVYVIHREIPGDPASEPVSRLAGHKGIRVVHRSESAQPGPTVAPTVRPTPPPSTVTPPPPPVVGYKLLNPAVGTGSHSTLQAGKIHTVPGSKGQVFVMDDNPGIEKLYLVASPTPLDDIEALFRTADGNSVEGMEARRVTEILAGYSENANVAFGKGITIESYGVSSEAGKPFMTEVDLAHYGPSSSPEGR